MLRTLAVLALSLAACNAGQAQDTHDEIYLRATVQAIVPLADFSGSITPVGTDPRFALTLRIDSVVPVVANFSDGTVVTLAIHSPSLLFAGEPTKGQTYDFSLGRKIENGKTVFVGLTTKGSQPKREETDHFRLSTPLVKAWREIPVGSPVYALDDAVGAKDWPGRALIQHIEFQTGMWYIWIEPGYSVFRIYPYLSKGSPQPSVYQGIVLKVKGTLSVDDLLAAIRNRTPTIKIDEYDVFGANSVSVQRYSRPHDEGGPRR